MKSRMNRLVRHLSDKVESFEERRRNPGIFGLNVPVLGRVTHMA